MTKLETEYLKQMGIEPENYVQPMAEIVPLAPRKVKFSNWKAITYAKDYCGQTANTCGAYYDQPGKTDCAHFIAHCLSAGGIAIKPGDGSTTDCPAGLAMRNTDLVAALTALATDYDNVQELGISDAIIGDIGFLNNLIRPSHAFMICEPVNLGDPLKPAKVWSHTAARCCGDMGAEIRQWFATMFRITDAQ
ncbi:amidase domain-containing protein [Hoeflea sp. AS16]|uniref:amidase domain-containing protein n=1 Tax=Hoeflea sp. AS16 TaxID=3135779 RepID=UPI00317FE470